MATPARAAAKSTVKSLVGAPAMITLPVAYLLTSLLADDAGFPYLLAAVLVSFLIALGDWFTSDETWDSWKDYAARGVYLVFNVAILMGLLLGKITLGQV